VIYDADTKLAMQGPDGMGEAEVRRMAEQCRAGVEMAPAWFRRELRRTNPDLRARWMHDEGLWSIERYYPELGACVTLLKARSLCEQTLHGVRDTLLRQGEMKRRRREWMDRLAEREEARLRERARETVDKYSSAQWDALEAYDDFRNGDTSRRADAFREDVWR